jgi:hypothetical protein
MLNVTAFNDATVHIGKDHFEISKRKQKEAVKTLKNQLEPLYQTIL